MPPLPSTQEIRTQTSVGMETPTQTVERAKRLVAPTTIKAADLTAPPPPVTAPPPPVQGSIPSQTGAVVQNVAKDINGLITAQTQEAQRARELAQEMGALGDGPSLTDMFQQERNRLGIDQNMQELKDIQLQLADMDTASGITKVRVEGAAGQTMGQAQREVTQEDKENAVRTAGLAARAAVLQGNINTATQLAKDAVNLAFQDRTLKAQNVLNQLNYYQGIVDDQTAQLIEQDKRQYEAELARIEELKTNISTAMVNGATQAEIGQLNDPNLDDASKLALAQSITARGANEMRGLDMEAKRANIAQSWASVAKSNTDRLLSLAAAGDAGAIGELGFDPRTIEEELDPTTKRQVEEKYASNSSLLNLVGQYKEIIDTKGFTNQVFGDPETLGKVTALRGLITAEYKRAEALGTLDAGLLTLMESIIGTEPTSSIIGWGKEGNALTNLTGRKSDKLSSQLETVVNTLSGKQAEYALRLGINPSVLAPEDEAEIDAAYGLGATNTTTPSGAFNPANFYQ